MTEAGSRRRPIIGGNWKMNTTLTEAVDLAERLVAGLGAPEGVDVVVFPPFTNLAAVSEILGSGSIGLGAQDVFWEQSGAFTGEISTAMLLSVSATHVIAGHSERRHLLGETDDIVNRKARAALAAGLTVIMAVGETRAQRQANQTERVIADQLRGSLDGVSAGQTADLVIAYEPVWAIGTGETASPPQARRRTPSFGVGLRSATVLTWLIGFASSTAAALPAQTPPTSWLSGISMARWWAEPV